MELIGCVLSVLQNLLVWPWVCGELACCLSPLEPSVFVG